MNSGNQGWQVAPHGIVGYALFGLVIVWLVHMLGFRVVAAARIGR